MELAYGVNYMKSINAVIGVQAGFLSGALTNSSGTLDFSALTAKGLVNLSNLSSLFSVIKFFDAFKINNEEIRMRILK